jgi:hypothetical protein
VRRVQWTDGRRDQPGWDHTGSDQPGSDHPGWDHPGWDHPERPEPPEPPEPPRHPGHPGHPGYREDPGRPGGPGSRADHHGDPGDWVADRVGLVLQRFGRLQERAEEMVSRAERIFGPGHQESRPRLTLARPVQAERLGLGVPPPGGTPRARTAVPSWPPISGPSGMDR